MFKKIAKVVCPNCESTVVAYRASGGRVIVTTTGGLILGGVGALIGVGIGITALAVGVAGTVPLGAVGAVVGSGLGYIISDKTLDKPKCPKCKHNIDLAI